MNAFFYHSKRGINFAKIRGFKVTDYTSPFTKPRAATPSEVPAHPAFPGRGTMLQPLGCRDIPVLPFWLPRFSSLGLKSRIDARIAPVLTLWLHRFASLGLKSRIDAWIALDLTSLLHRFASLGLKSRIDATPSCRQV